MSVSGTTEHYGFLKPVFLSDFWHQKQWQNLDRIDALLFLIAGDMELTLGNWTNSTIYAVGDRVVDTADASVWQCIVANTSGASPQTMAQYRAANPTHWADLAATLAIRGAWDNDEVYGVNDVVYDASEHVYAICVTAHTSGSAPDTIRDDAVNWAYIADLEPFLTAAAAAQAAAELAETNAETAQAAAEAAATGLTGVLTTRGDLVFRNATVAARLPAGTSGYVLKTTGTSGDPIWSSPSGVDFLATGDFTAVAGLEIPLDAVGFSAYKSFELVIHRIRPSTDNANLILTVSTDGGATFLAGTNYRWTRGDRGSGGFGLVEHSENGGASVVLATSIGNVASEGLSGRLTFFNPASTTFSAAFSFNMNWVDPSSEFFSTTGGGVTLTAGDITDLRLAFSAGNIAAVGSYSLYGYR